MHRRSLDFFRPYGLGPIKIEIPALKPGATFLRASRRFIQLPLCLIRSRSLGALHRLSRRKRSTGGPLSVGLRLEGPRASKRRRRDRY